MIPILISHILRTNLRGLDNLFMDKGKIYTFLNPCFLFDGIRS